MFAASLGVALATMIQEPQRQSERTFQTSLTSEVKLRYWEYLPKGYEESKENFPLVIFLHGAGERGDDLAKVKIHGPAKMVDTGSDYPFILISPQCPANRIWDVRELSALLKDIEATHRVDKDRIYLTGLSMGGYGTWEWIGREPKRFAAAIPICGGGSRMWTFGLGNMPIWAVHGDADPIVPFSESRNMLDRAKLVGCHLRFTVVHNGGHDVWTDFYGKRDWVDWLLQFNLKDRLSGKVNPAYREETIEGGGE